MFRVFKVDGAYQIFWCPSAPLHYEDKVPAEPWKKPYSTKSAAYRRCAQLQDKLDAQNKAEDAHIEQKAREQKAREAA